MQPGRTQQQSPTAASLPRYTQPNRQLLPTFTDNFKRMKLYESLYIFLRYKQDINYLMEFIIDFGYHKKAQNEFTLKDQAHYVTLYHTILMNTCSFLDEYNKHFQAKSEPEFHERILSVKKIAKPAYKKMKEWKDLREYRNNMIAHNFRINEDVFSFKMSGQYKVPRTYLDLVLFRKYLMMIFGIIEAEFSDHMPKINDFIKSFEVKELQVNYDTVEDELTLILSEINKLCSENDKPYILPVELFMNL